MKGGESVVVDANVVLSIYKAETGSLDPYPESVHLADEFAAQGCRVVVDDEGHIVQEWQDGIDNDWFENWYVTLASSTNFAAITVDPCTAILKKLRTEYGFPNGENRWLVKAAVSEATGVGHCVLLSHDLDFRDPKKKKASAKERENLLNGTTRGRLAKFLAKSGVEVLSAPQCTC